MGEKTAENKDLKSPAEMAADEASCTKVTQSWLQQFMAMMNRTREEMGLPPEMYGIGSLARSVTVADVLAYRDNYREQDAGFVYFMEDALGQIKIGTTKNLAVRRAQINLDPRFQCGAAGIRILAALPGGYRTESAIHHRFSGSRIKGEWFRPDPPLLSLIAEIQEQIPLPDSLRPDWLKTTARTTAVAGGAR